MGATLKQAQDENLHQQLMETYREKRRTLVRFLTARLGSAAAAEDVVQDVFLKLAALDGDLSVDNPVALIYRIAKNLAVDHLRHQSSTSARDRAWGASSCTILHGDLVAEEVSAEQALAARQRLELVTRVVDGMPPRMQRAFRLHKFEGQSHAQTAQRMGISVKAVEKHISAALKILTARLRGAEKPPP